MQLLRPMILGAVIAIAAKVAAQEVFPPPEMRVQTGTDPKTKEPVVTTIDAAYHSLTWQCVSNRLTVSYAAPLQDVTRIEYRFNTNAVPVTETGKVRFRDSHLWTPWRMAARQQTNEGSDACYCVFLDTDAVAAFTKTALHSRTIAMRMRSSKADERDHASMFGLVGLQAALAKLPCQANAK